VDRILFRGPVRRSLVEAASGAQLLVVGTAGGRVVDRVLGSVTQHALRHAPCPVVVVPPEAAAGHGVVAGIDGSPAAAAALRAALDLAGVRGAPVRAVLAWEPSMPDGWANVDVAGRVADELVARALAGQDDRRLVTTIVRRGRPADALVAEADGAELLVVGARGLGRVAGRLLGSVSTAVVERSPVPTMVVRAPDES
jgi:nucleotide-binding universal stress UspA family protein